MNNNQIKLLYKHGYEVVPELNYLVVETIKVGTAPPKIFITFDNETKLFGLGIMHVNIYGNELKKYKKNINKKITLVEELNSLGDKNDKEETCMS